MLARFMWSCLLLALARAQLRPHPKLVRFISKFSNAQVGYLPSALLVTLERIAELVELFSYGDQGLAAVSLWFLNRGGMILIYAA